MACGVLKLIETPRLHDFNSKRLFSRLKKLEKLLLSQQFSSRTRGFNTQEIYAHSGHCTFFQQSSFFQQQQHLVKFHTIRYLCSTQLWSSPDNINEIEWDFEEFLHYKEVACFAYVRKRVNWTDSFESATNFYRMCNSPDGKVDVTWRSPKVIAHQYLFK